jgi:flagellar hook-basal body complex protein FliE
MIEAIAAISPALTGSAASALAPAAPDFAGWLERGVEAVDRDVAHADHAVQMLATGQAESLPDVMIALQNASTSLSLMLQVRDRLVSAYQEILQMQI